MCQQRNIWRAILAAWIHDPAEKALILMRGESHEAGTVSVLQQALFGQSGIPDDLRNQIKKADRWAAAADRPQFGAGGRDSWAQVRFDQRPELVHPLSGERVVKINKFGIEVEEIKAVSQDHFKKLIHNDGSQQSVDEHLTALAFWRFGPEPPAPELGELWTQMPADTRIPDHTIWAHLDLSSAFASAFVGDPNSRPALLNMAFGPVQDFIAQARTTSDLWAGSHLLSRMAWEGMRVVCERLGPGAILFPHLRGIPQVDLWLRSKGVSESLFEGENWQQSGSDANPLFGAALPNKFLALVPDSMADELGSEVEKSIRNWVEEQGKQTIDRLFHEAQLTEGKDIALGQLQQQLEGFPEIHWSVTPWFDEEGGRKALTHFYPQGTKEPGFLGSMAWNILSDPELKQKDGTRFFKPNDGTLYPLNYDLAGRSLEAHKSARAFRQLQQEGFRCSLCGEREWLTHDRGLLNFSPREQQQSLWAKVDQPSWARKGEHLCALCAIKRLWPTRFAEEVGVATGRTIHRFVVSTHTMAMVSSLDQWRVRKNRRNLPQNWMAQLHGLNSVALPAGLAKKLSSDSDETVKVVRKLPALLQHYQDSEQDSSDLEREIFVLLEHKPESYYALIKMDGDSMGKWLSGHQDDGICYGDAFHSKVREGLRQRRQFSPKLDQYLDTQREVSPARHMSISSALNGFAVEIAPYVVEEMFKGKLLYAGGDDVLAMISVDDLLPCLTVLRYVYSGIALPQEAWSWLGDPVNRQTKMANGHIYFRKRLYRMMGRGATASAGAVIAHHQSPLGKVMKELQTAEKRAKENDKDSFSISLLRRSGSRSEFTAKWQLGHNNQEEIGFESTPMGLLLRVRKALTDPALSRRVAYILQDWLKQLPEQPSDGMLIETMGYQFARQSNITSTKELFYELGSSLSHQALKQVKKGDLDKKILKSYLSEQLGIAEFLAREGRG